MTSQREDESMQIIAFAAHPVRQAAWAAPQATPVPAASDSCSAPFAVHDLAALSEGNLSRDGMQRLADHVRSCRTCMAALVILVRDVQRSQGTGTHDVHAWIAAGADASLLRARLSSDE